MHVHSGHGFIKLIFFTASSSTFLSKIGFLKNIMPTHAIWCPCLTQTKTSPVLSTYVFAPSMQMSTQ